MVLISYLPRAASVTRDLQAWGFRALLLAAITAACGVHGQSLPARALASPSTNSAISTPATILETAKDRLSRVRAELAAPPSASAGAYVRRSLLQRLERLFEQEIANTAELESLKTSREQINREAREWTAFREPRPYSIFLTDNLRESIHVEELEISKSESALSTLQQLIEGQKASLIETEEKIRQLNEALEKAGDQGDRSREREIQRLHSQVAAATIGVLDLERRIHNEKLSLSRTHLDLLRKQLVFANASSAFTEADLQKARAVLETEQKRVQAELTQAETREGPASQALETARGGLRQVQSETVPNPSQMARAQELLDLREAQLESVRSTLNGLRFILQANSIERVMWEARFESFRTESAATVRQIEQKLREFRSRIALWKNYYDSQLAAASSQSALQEERLAAIDPASELRPLAVERLAALREKDQILLRVVRQMERGDRLVQRLAETLNDASESLPLAARARNAVTDTRSLLSRLWNLELFAAQDTIVVEGQQITGKRSVTLGKITSAILILVIGYWLTDRLSRLVQPIIIARFHIDPNQANLIRRWVRAVMVVSLALFSLVWVKIPLTVFAFAGGALAIALGFGMQTMLKNFVSGIIILFERPFRVGDVLDVGGKSGTIVSVGIRSSVLQQADGTETLIPNSTLLESSVTNWTYSNRKVRFTVAVGVAYGSDTRRVVQLLAETADRHGLVEKNPPPQVIFSDFGDSALMFEVRFWVDVIKSNSAQVASDLRQMISGVFAENGIVIAYPQRDFHLNAARPLQVQVVSTADARPAQDGPGNRSPEKRDQSLRSPTEPVLP